MTLYRARAAQVSTTTKTERFYGSGNHIVDKSDGYGKDYYSIEPEGCCIRQTAVF